MSSKKESQFFWDPRIFNESERKFCGFAERICYLLTKYDEQRQVRQMYLDDFDVA